MPIKAILQNVDGTRRIKSLVDSEGGLNKCLPIGDPNFPLLQFIDPYGNAVFNPKQMAQLLRELELLISRSSDEGSKGLLDGLRELARECQGANHLYLRFVGD